MDNCKSCKFFLKTNGDQGLCRRFPAVPIPSADGGVYSHFPVMLNEGWCGEFKQEEGGE